MQADVRTGRGTLLQQGSQPAVCCGLAVSMVM